jgi:hypothetical protein
MHKSGTTLVSQILHHSGISMGEEVDPCVSYDGGNKYERVSTKSLNFDILGLKDSIFIDFDAPEALQMTDDQRTSMRKTIRECSEAHIDWGFKDPRTALVYPLWASELPEHRIIAVYRSPDEIWPRFRYRRLHHRYKNPFRAHKLVKRWCEYNSNVLTYLQTARMDFLVLNYRQLMTTEGEFNRLQDFVGCELNDQRKKGLYRGRSQVYPLMEMAKWLVHKRTGYLPGKIIEQFEALRQR